MNRFHLIMFLTLFSLISCRKDMERVVDIDAPVIPQDFYEINVEGIVFDPNGVPLSGVKLSIGDIEQVSDENGVYQFKKIISDNTELNISCERKEQFRSMERIFVNGNAAYNQNIEMIDLENNYSFSSGDGIVVYLKNGGQVVIPPNVLANDLGVYNGEVNFNAFWLDAESKESLIKSPGDNSGLSLTNEAISIQSFGSLVIELFGIDGERLEIIEGSAITIKLPISSSVGINGVENPNLYTLDQKSGRWIETGTAQKESGFFVTDIENLGWWKCGIHDPAAKLCIELKFGDDSKAHNQEASILSNGFLQSGITNSKGQLCLMVPTDRNLSLEVASYCSSQAELVDLGSIGNNESLSKNIGSTNPVRITGELLNCDGTSVECGYALIKHKESYILNHVSDNGIYQFALNECEANLEEADVITVDNINETISLQQLNFNQGSNYNIDFNSCDTPISFLTLLNDADETVIISGCLARQTSAELLITAGVSAEEEHAILGIQGSGDGIFKANFFTEGFSTSVEGDTHVTILDYQDIGGYIKGEYRNGGTEGSFVAKRIR